MHELHQERQDRKGLRNRGQESGSSEVWTLAWIFAQAILDMQNPVPLRAGFLLGVPLWWLKSHFVPARLGAAQNLRGWRERILPVHDLRIESVRGPGLHDRLRQLR